MQAGNNNFKKTTEKALCTYVKKKRLFCLHHGFYVHEKPDESNNIWGKHMEVRAYVCL